MKTKIIEVKVIQPNGNVFYLAFRIPVSRIDSADTEIKFSKAQYKRLTDRPFCQLYTRCKCGEDMMILADKGQAFMSCRCENPILA